jgi:hypothetical protein
MRNEGLARLLIGSCVLDKDHDEIEDNFQNESTIILPQRNINRKIVAFDFLTKFDDIKTLIEMQNIAKPDFKLRFNHYYTMLDGISLNKGDKYDKIKVMAIAIIKFVISETDGLVYKENPVENIHNQSEITHYEKNYIQLPKLANNLQEENKSELFLAFIAA